MGVKGLWSLLEPVARPIKLEKLEALVITEFQCIWLHQFLKAMRDKNGNSLKNAHLLGFFRRICKLLFYNIKPVFVFDGGIPALKRQTVVERRRRRAGKTKNLQKTAEKILANQLRLRAIEESEKKNDDFKPNTGPQNKPIITDDTVYYGEHNLTPAQLHKRKKMDEYELPPIIGGIESMIQKDDVRFANEEDLRRFIEEFKIKSDDIDIDSEGFRSLPLEMQYEIVGELRLKSRQTSYESLTQKFLEVGNNALSNKTTASSKPVRVAAERNREYVLIKNDDGFGGWTMGKSAGMKVEPIKLEPSSESDENDDWEEVNASTNENYVSEDEKIETIMAKFVALDKSHESLFSEGQTEELDLPLESFYAFWVSRMPPDFCDEFSDHETLIRTAFYEWDEEELEAQKSVVEKKLGKLKDGDEKKLEIFEYWRNLLSATLAWRQMRNTDLMDMTSKMENLDSDSLIDDDYESEDNTKNTNYNSMEASNVNETYDNSLEADSFPNAEKETMRLTIQSNSIDNDSVVNTEYKKNVLISDVSDLNASDETNRNVEKMQQEIDELSSRSVSSSKDIKTKLEQNISNTKNKFEFDLNLNGNQQEEAMSIDDDNHTEAKINELKENDNVNERDASIQMVEENSEFARFMSQLKSKDLNEIRQELNDEIETLNQQQRREMRDTDELTQTMINDCQQLLQLFGIPYIIAPMEAEAQCAELCRLSLVDGIVTDDSDVFLFGGTRVYKNMFNQQQFVECFLMHDLEREMNLDREKLIRLAHLLGSDYTEGLPGVGVVTAMEILNEFPDDNGLEKFKEWWNGVQSGLSMDEEAENSFRKKFASIIHNFSKIHVREAYINPQVDDSTMSFEWGVPDLNALKDFLMVNLLWTQDKIDETLIPIIRNKNQRNAESISTQRQQATIDSFFDMTGGTGDFPKTSKQAQHKSARIQRIVDGWKKKNKRSQSGTNNSSEENNNNSEEEMKSNRIGSSSSTRAIRRDRNNDNDDSGEIKNIKKRKVADEQGKTQKDNDGNMTSGTSSSDDSSEESDSDDDKSVAKRGRKLKTAKYSRFFPRPTKKISRAKKSEPKTSKDISNNSPNYVELQSMGSSSRGRGRGAGRGKRTRARGRGI
ncbi:10293_t:CDS:10 [Ambispora gerdemannii]|uniref:10293_t:CDS:1 n=1 Tax=Ambispora gerdemannii TaxID=144530 RepID=A0A9N8ZK28_9GLOM|nr:10293_t:CDS:10 [Ambispora gerdemannii]